MATTTATLSSGTGFEHVALTSWAGDAAFATTPVAGGQIEGPNTLTYTADDMPSGPDGTYTILYISPTGDAEAVEYQIGAGVVVPESATTPATFSGGADYTTATLAAGFDASTSAFQNWTGGEPATTWQIETLTAQGWFDEDGQYWKPAGAADGIQDVWVIQPDGTVAVEQFDNTGLGSVPDTSTEAPQGTWVIGEITKGQTTATLTPVYDSADADSYQYTLNASAWTSFTGAIELTDLEPETPYGGAVRAVNSIGPGAAESFSFITDRVPAPPVQDTSLPDLSLSEPEAISINLDDYFSRASSYAIAGLPAGSGLSLSGRVITGTTNSNDTDASPIAVTVTAANSDGSIQDAFSVSVVDDIPPVLSINSLTTLNTTPVVSGSAGDAVSLVLVVDGVTYTPSPLNGAWTQKLSLLSLNSYVMTLNGQDANGNAAAERKGWLKIVDEIAVSTEGLFRPLFRTS